MSETLLNADCLIAMKEIPDGSVDCVIADPPYYKIVNDSWDNQWGNVEQYAEFILSFANEAKRLLKNNGSIYIFGDDKTIAYIQVKLDRILLLLNSIVWYKINNQSVKAAPNLRSWAPMTERILFYTCDGSKTGLQTIHDDKDCFQSIKSYMRGERDKIMKEQGFSTIEEFNVFIRKLTDTSSVVDRHYFADSQYVFPTEELYKKLQSTGLFRKEYEELRKEYEELRRPFNADLTTLDVISGPIINQNDNTEHPTTKPVWLMERLVRVSTNENMTVLDPFMGSGTTGVACVHTKRNFIGIEISKEYFEVAKSRIEGAQLPLI